MITKEITTLWQGKAGIHAKYLNRAFENRCGLKIIFKNEVMVIPLEKLKSGYTSVQTFPDKFGRGEYKLYYYNWQPNIEIVKTGGGQDSVRFKSNTLF
jgi:hypothetical protein